MKSFRDQIYEHLRRAIVSGDIKGEQAFKDTDLAEEFGVSRMPVRDALKKLETEGLIVHTPKRGYTVLELSLQDVAWVFSIRKTLEGLAAVYASRHITATEIDQLRGIIAEGRSLFSRNPENLCPEYEAITRRFNASFIESCRVPRLIRLVYTHRELLERYDVISKVLTQCGETLIDHREALTQALADRDEDQARSIWENHLDVSMHAYLQASGFHGEVDYA